LMHFLAKVPRKVQCFGLWLCLFVYATMHPGPFPGGCKSHPGARHSIRWRWYPTTSLSHSKAGLLHVRFVERLGGKVQCRSHHGPWKDYASQEWMHHRGGWEFDIIKTWNHGQSVSVTTTWSSPFPDSRSDWPAESHTQLASSSHLDLSELSQIIDFYFAKTLI
jgi:hypothetical protein